MAAENVHKFSAFCNPLPINCIWSGNFFELADNEFSSCTLVVGFKFTKRGEERVHGLTHFVVSVIMKIVVYLLSSSQAPHGRNVLNSRKHVRQGTLVHALPPFLLSQESTGVQAEST